MDMNIDFFNAGYNIFINLPAGLLLFSLVLLLYTFFLKKKNYIILAVKNLFFNIILVYLSNVFLFDSRPLNDCDLPGLTIPDDRNCNLAPDMSEHVSHLLFGNYSYIYLILVIIFIIYFIKVSRKIIKNIRISN